MKRSGLNFFRYRFNLDEDKAEENEIISSIRKNVEFKGTNLWALVFAIFIASIGLNVNSTAVIIGAMLISPLMGPIMGVGLGLGIYDSNLIKIALKNLLIAVVISLAASWIYFSLSPLSEAQSELLARTRPTIWDVLIALFGGLAGVIASTRKNISNTIPGVAIATALMPPLCTAGFGLASGNLSYFMGAFYLFIINSVFISISTFLIIRFLKFKPVSQLDADTAHRLKRTIWTVAMLTIIPSCYLAYIFVNEEFFKRKTLQYINHEIKPRELYVIERTIEPLNEKITLVVYGRDLTDSLKKLLISEKRKYGLDNVDLEIRQANEGAISSKDLNLLREDIQQQLMMQNSASSEKDKKIKKLQADIKNIRSNDIEAVYKEFKALYGDVAEFSISKAPMFTPNETDTIQFVYIKPLPKQKVNKQSLEKWLSVRLKNKVKVVITSDR